MELSDNKLLQWMMKNHSFVTLMFGVIAGILITIIEYNFFAPMEDSECLALILVNVVISLLLIFCIKQLKVRK